MMFFQLGMKDPPTIADMENEIADVSKELVAGKIPLKGRYLNRRPKTKKGNRISFIIGGLVLVVLIVVGVTIYFFYCQSDSTDENRKQIGSDTSIASKES